MNHSIRNISSAILIFSLVILSSCMKNNQEALKQTDSLMTILDSSEKIFSSYDTTRVKNILDSTDHKVELLKKYSPDSLDKETTILLADYLHVLQALEKFPAERKNISSQISFSRKQLNDMKHDLSDGAMSKEEFAKNFPEESTAATLQPVRIPGSTPRTALGPKGEAKSSFFTFSEKTFIAVSSATNLSAL